MQDNEDHEPQSVIECRQRNDWPKWQDSIQSELNSLAKREVFGPIKHLMGLNLLVTNGFLCEKEMRKMKYKGIKHALWHEDFLKGLASTMKRHTHPLWMQ